MKKESRIASTKEVRDTKGVGLKRKSGPAVVTGEVRAIPLNRASALDLEALPGIGPALAGRIVSYRSEQGKFRELSELMEVKGIGFKKLEQLRALLSLD